MTKLAWDQAGEKRYETGIDRGVLAPAGGDLVAWNGLITVTETPAGAESNKQYADNTVYLNLLSLETFGGTIAAFSYPLEFEECDGTALVAGVQVGQQSRKGFNMAYRTLVGTDEADAGDYGEKIHLVYGAKASPSEKAFSTINDTPAPINFSWTFSTTPVGFVDHDLKPTALIVVDSNAVDSTAFQALKDQLWGTDSTDASFPSPDEVLALFEAVSLTTVNLDVDANKPTFVSGTGVITLPAVTGVQWKVNGVNKAPGAQPAIASGADATVTAHAETGYVLNGDADFGFHRP